MSGPDLRAAAARVEEAVRAAGAADCAVVPVEALTGRGPACTRCGMPAAFPGVGIDATGTCSLCALLDERGPQIARWFREEPDLEPVLRGRAAARPGVPGRPDLLLLYSGGKDSTYVLYRLVDMGLRVMTFTFDNGYISSTALRNVERVTGELGVEHVTMTRADQKRIFRESLAEHKSVCNGCFRSLLDLSTELAHERGIPTIVTGLSRGQIMDERLSWFHGQGIFDPDDIDHRLRLGREVYHRTGGSDVTGDALDTVEVVDFYRYSPVTKDGIRALLRSRSDLWAQPSDTGFCSSNCIVNDVGVYVHTTERGYHNYEAPTRWEVRLGHLSREEADAELQVPEDTTRVRRMLASIGYPDPAVSARPGERLVVHCVPVPGRSLDDVRTAAAAALPAELVPGQWVQAASIPRARGRVQVVGLAPPPARGAEHGGPAVPPAAAPARFAPTAAQAAILAAGGAPPRAALLVARIPLGGPELVAAARRAALAVLLHHDALRLRLVPGGGAFTVAGPAGPRPVVRLDLSGTDAAAEPVALERARARLAARLDPVTGPLVQIAAIDRGDRPPALLVVVHRLAADPRSFRQLLADVAGAVARAAAGEPVDLPPVAAYADLVRTAAGPGEVSPAARRAAEEIGARVGGAVEVVDHGAGPDRPRGVACLDAPVVVGEGRVRARYEHVGDPTALLPAGSAFAVGGTDPAATLVGPSGPDEVVVVGTDRGPSRPGSGHAEVA